jgi:hypothetical protein
MHKRKPYPEAVDHPFSPHRLNVRVLEFLDPPSNDWARLSSTFAVALIAPQTLQTALASESPPAPDAQLLPA